MTHFDVGPPEIVGPVRACVEFSLPLAWHYYTRDVVHARIIPDEIFQANLIMKSAGKNRAAAEAAPMLCVLMK